MGQFWGSSWQYQIDDIIKPIKIPEWLAQGNLKSFRDFVQDSQLGYGVILPEHYKGTIVVIFPDVDLFAILFHLPYPHPCSLCERALLVSSID